ncbi:MAG: T9SS type A sorting domain-containing protein [Bacteroidetes bacterium]|nr:T9SS type A sorting domain-containing protein [Bacteroidota bacterium]
MKKFYTKLQKYRFLLAFGFLFQLTLIANSQPLTSVIGTINGDTVVCQGNVFSIVGYGFFGSGNYTKYLWTGDTGPLFDVNSQLPGFSTSNIGTYNLTFWVWDDNGDSASSNMSISVLVLPDAIITANGPTTFCQGGSVLLSSINTPGLIYQWRKGNFDIPGAITSNYTATQSGVYRLRVTSVNGCSKLSNPITVVVNPAPAATSSNDSPVCNGDDVHFTSSGGTGYQWSGPGGFFNNQQNPTISGIALIGNGTYTVTVTDGNGCAAISTTNVVVYPLPTVIAGSNAPICAGSTLNLTSSGGLTYSWTGPNGFVSTLQNPSINNVTTDANGIYTVTATNINGCSNSAMFNVNINGSPTINVNSPTICFGTSATLTATGATSYVWSNGSTLNPLTVTPLADASYTVTGTTAGCSSSAISNVTVSPRPVVNVNNEIICSGSSASLTASGASSYLWSNGSTENPLVVSPLNTTTYSVTGTALGCPGTTSAIVTVNPSPVLTVNNPTICSGSQTVITANGANSYLWSNGATTNSINVSPLASAYYTVTGTSTGCSSTAISSVTVNAVPVITVNSATICNGTSATIIANGANSYLWNNGATTNAITVSPTATTSYTVSGTSVGCSSSAMSTITVNPIPIVTVNSTGICTGSTAVLTANGANSYLWSNGSTMSSITVSPVATTNYSVTGTSNGCSSSAISVVTVSPIPTITVNSPTICNGTNAILTANGAISYTWSNGVNGNPISVSPAISTSYTVVGSSFGCTASAVSNVTVNPSPSITVNNAAICSGNSATLTANGGLTYLWNSGATTNSIVVSPAATVNYTVTGTSNGCSGSAISTVTVNSVPAVTVNSPSICSGSSVILQATGANSYLWSDGTTNNSITVSPAITTNYTVTGNPAGCSGSAVSTVTVNPIPILTVNSPSICSGATAILTASGANNYLWDNGSTSNSITVSPIVTTNYSVTGTSNGCSSLVVSTVTVNPSLNLSVTNYVICNGSSATLIATGANSYLWDDGSTNDTIIVSPTSSASYTVTGTSFGCSSSAISNVSVFNLPTDPISASVDRDNFCSNDNGNIVLSVNGGSGNVLNWYTGSCGTTLIGSGNNFVLPSPTTTTTYYASWQAPACGNSNCVSITVNVISGVFPPTAVLVDRNDFCADDNGDITLTANGGSGTVMSWYSLSCGAGFIGNGVSLTIPSPNITTTYYARWETTNCGNSVCDSITVNINPIIVANAGNDTTIFIGGTASLTAAGGTIYLWGNGETTANINVSPIVNTTYYVSVSSVFGCTSIDSVTVFVIANPTVDAGMDDTICSGSTAVLTANGNGNLLWDTGETSQSIIVSPLITTTYFVTSSIGIFSSIDSVTVFVNPSPTAFIGNDTNLCSGHSLLLNAQGNGNYLWSNGETSSSILVSPLNDTIFTLLVTQGACSAIADIFVWVLPSPVITISNDTTICNGNSTALTVTGLGSYYWSNGMSDNSILVNPTDTTTYYVTVSNSFGCQAFDSTTVSVLPFTLPVINSNGPTGFCDSSQVSAILSLTDIYMNYTWSNGDTSNVLVVNNVGSYNVSVSSANGCAGIADTITILVYPEIPDPIIMSDSPTEFCQGDSAVLYLNNDYYIYFWNSGSYTPSIQVNETGGYAVTVSSFYGCIKISAPVDVVVNPIPSADFSYSDSYLTLQLYDFSTNADDYLWDFGDGQTSTLQSPSHTYAAQGTYTFSLIVSNDCGSDTTFATITLPTSNGIDNQDEISNFNLYPNPATNEITISYESNNLSDVEINILNPIGKIIITDISGKQTMKFKKTMNIETLADGVYFMEIKEHDLKTMKKFVKN